MDFVSELTQKTELCNSWLDELCPKGEGLHSKIYEAMNYSLSAGGKRIRPILVAAVCEMLGGDVNCAKHFACAVEFIHTYSLIHDDLPCMDNDDLRRGKPTNHKVYGETMAVLAGDSLLNFAFETALESELDAETVIKCLKVLSHASGADGMVGGQVIDINGAANSNELMTVHEMKTGALICGAAAMGAIIGGATEEEYDRIVEYASLLGMAFQIKDDILDVTADEHVLGKHVGSDRESEKCTFVTLYGLQGSSEILYEYTTRAIDALDMFGEKAEFLKSLADYLLKRNK